MFGRGMGKRLLTTKDTKFQVRSHAKTNSAFLEEHVRKILVRNIRRPAPPPFLSEAGDFYFCPYFSAYLLSFQMFEPRH